MDLQQPASGVGESILIVDAADDERQMYAVALRARGYTVRESADGENGLVETRVASPDLVVADVVLPKLDGLQLLTAIRRDRLTRELPVIMLTGYDQPLSVIAEAKAAGATTVRIKPCLPATLLHDVHEILERCGQLREAAQEARVRSQAARARALATLSRAIDLTTRPCPVCGAALHPAGVTRASVGHLYFRPCPQGCGWWYYDARTGQMCKLV